jgi:hypothetical protein
MQMHDECGLPSSFSFGLLWSILYGVVEIDLSEKKQKGKLIELIMDLFISLFPSHQGTNMLRF